MIKIRFVPLYLEKPRRIQLDVSMYSETLYQVKSKEQFVVNKYKLILNLSSVCVWVY